MISGCLLIWRVIEESEPSGAQFLARRKTASMASDEFKLLADITRPGRGFLSIEAPIYQILILLKQASPLDEITAIAHQPSLEPCEELDCRQAILSQMC
jgi:hypothetical protein